MQSSWISPARRSSFSTTGTPPTSKRSLATYFPPGFRSTKYGVSWKMSQTSSRSKSMPASCAIAGRCSPPLVEPPVHATTRAAFSRLLRVTTSRARMPFASRFITATPLAVACWSRLS